MKLSESHVRLMIRRQLIKEYLAAGQNNFSWKTCNRIDLPDHLIKSASGKSAIKGAEKAAALAAQVYGVPGFVCDIFSTLMGDDPNRTLNRDLESKAKPKKSKSIKTGLYAKYFERSINEKAKYIEEITDNNAAADDIKKAAVGAVKQKLDENIALISARNSIAGSNPVEVIDHVNVILLISDNNSVNLVKKLSQQEEIDDNTINNLIADQAIAFYRAVALRNLLNSDISESYKDISEYKTLVTQLSRVT